MPKITPKQLRDARLAAGLTQKAAAALCDVDERTYQRWETGETSRIRAVYLTLLRTTGTKTKKRSVSA